MRDPKAITHPLAHLSGQLFDNGYLLPVAERLSAEPEGWTATTLATALGVQGANKLRPALRRLLDVGLIKISPYGRDNVFEVADKSHPFWSFVAALNQA